MSDDPGDRVREMVNKAQASPDAYADLMTAAQGVLAEMATLSDYPGISLGQLLAQFSEGAHALLLDILEESDITPFGLYDANERAN